MCSLDISLSCFNRTSLASNLSSLICLINRNEVLNMLLECSMQSIQLCKTFIQLLECQVIVMIQVVICYQSSNTCTIKSLINYTEVESEVLLEEQEMILFLLSLIVSNCAVVLSAEKLNQLMILSGQNLIVSSLCLSLSQLLINSSLQCVNISCGLSNLSIVIQAIESLVHISNSSLVTKQLVQDCVIRLLLLIACRQVPVVLNTLQRLVQCFNIVLSNITQTKGSCSKVVLLLHLVNLCTNISNFNIDEIVLHSINLSLECLSQVLELSLVSNTSLTLIVGLSQCYLGIVVKFNLSESICSRILHVERIELAEVLVSISQYCICSLKVLGNLTISLIVSNDILRSLNCISVNI